MGDYMKMERRRLSELRPAEYNPRVPLQPEDKEYQDIKCSIEENGYLDPIVINYDGTIIKGHQLIGSRPEPAAMSEESMLLGGVF